MLIIHLKRFSFSRFRRNKLDNEVAFPLRGLDLSAHLLCEQVLPPCCSTTHHQGSLLSNGAALIDMQAVACALQGGLGLACAHMKSGPRLRSSR